MTYILSSNIPQTANRIIEEIGYGYNWAFAVITAFTATVMAIALIRFAITRS